MVGYDFDGVATSGNYKITPDDVIITGNTYKDLWRISSWMDSNNVDCAVYYMPDLTEKNKPYYSAVWKSEIINRLNIPQYFEDSELQHEIIKALCPKCEVIKVKGEFK